MSLIDGLITDLSSLLNDQKKNQPIKQLISQCLEQVKAFKSSSNSSQSTQNSNRMDQFPTQSILQVIIKIPETKVSHSLMLGISVIQKLITLNLLKTSEDTVQALNFLYLSQNVADEQVQLRLVQSTLQILHLGDLNHQEYFEKLFAILFSLVVQKNAIIQNTTMTGLFQLTSLLMQQYLENQKLYSKQASNLFMEFIKGMQGQKLPWISNPSPSTKGVCRDLLLAVLKQLTPVIKSDEQLMKYVTDHLSPLIYEEIGVDSNDVNFNARRIRGAFRIIECVNKDVQLIKHIQILFTKAPVFHYTRFWILEGINALFSNTDIILLLHRSSNSNETTYLQYLFQLLKIASEQDPKQLPKVGSNNTPSGSNQQQFYNMKHSNFIDSNLVDFQEAPSYQVQSFMKLEIETCLSISESLLAIAKNYNVKLGSKNYSSLKESQIFLMSASEKSNGLQEMQSIAQSLWQIQLSTVKRLMKGTNDERLVQVLLNVLQIWINITGSVGCYKGRDQLLSYLASLCLNESNSQVDDKAIQCSKILFNIAHCLGGLLDVGSWHTILKTMHGFEAQLLKTQMSNIQDQQMDSAMINQEIQILQSVLNGLFSHSFKYDDQLLLQLIDALNQLTLGLMENISTNSSSSIMADPKGLQFGLQKISEIVKVNWDRVDIFWNFIAAHFNCIVNCKHKILRELASQTFTNIIMEGFNYFQKAYKLKQESDEEMSPVLQSKNNKWNRKCWQESLLSPIDEMVTVKYNEVREILLQSLFKLIQNNGHEINFLGFMSIIKILSICSSDDADRNNYVNVGFHLLEQIIGQYLHIFEPKTTKILLQLIKNFRQKTTEQNISFISVGMIWQLADNLAKLNDTLAHLEMEDLWLDVLLNLKDLCLDTAPDVRQSALHIIIQITLINCSSFRVDFQIIILRHIILQVLDALVGRVAQLQQLKGIFHVQTPRFVCTTPKFTVFSEQEFVISKDQAIQWEETLKQMVQNLSKIIKKLSSIPDFRPYSQSIHDDVFIRLFIMFKINSLELKLEIVKLVRENCELIISLMYDNSMEWSKEMIASINEFLFQKITDTRDIKTLINRILPEICETFTLFLKAYDLNIKFYEHFIDEFFETYQVIIEQPQKIENIANIKVWMDEKHLHDFIEDYAQNFETKQQEFQLKVMRFLLHNIHRSGGPLTKVQDLLIRKYISLFQTLVCSDYYKRELYSKSKEFEDFISECLELATEILSLRYHPENIQNNKPLWNQCAQPIIQIIDEYSTTLDTENYLTKILQPVNWQDGQIHLECLKSSVEMELMFLNYIIRKHEPLHGLLFHYWTSLTSSSYTNEELLYETRRKFLLEVFKFEFSSITREIVTSNLQQFIKSEQIQGSMPLPRKQVQETALILSELEKLGESLNGQQTLLGFFGILTDLIVTKEQDIKVQLQGVFRQIGARIKQMNQ